MKLLIGLGNPGEKYEKTRHNVGVMLVDRAEEMLKQVQHDNVALNDKSGWKSLKNSNVL